MTLEKVHEPIAMHSDLSIGYRPNAAKMALGEVIRDHKQQVVEDLIRDYRLEAQWEMKPGTKFESAFKS